MGDFFLDLRPATERDLGRVAGGLAFSDRTRVLVVAERTFGLVLTYTGEEGLWAPCRAVDGTWVGVVGRLALDESEWVSGEAARAEGGLAARVIYERYRGEGVGGLEGLNGNCAVIVHDVGKGELHVVNDRAGAFPVFEARTGDGWAYGSHPDVVADAVGEGYRWDEVSQAEFTLTSTVTPPYTYYERIRFVEAGTRIKVRLGDGPQAEPVSCRYHRFIYRGKDGVGESELAEQLAVALRKAVRRRTLPRLGRSALALSGGLDSRTLLACSERRDNLFTFCLYDDPNPEFEIARRVAAAAGVPFLPVRRGFEYYGEQAEQGVRISGGMGTLANNHFLGALDRLHDEGMENLLTGCYCDYLFKGLPLNRRLHWLTGRESLAGFRHEYYFRHQLPATPIAEQVRARWEARIPIGLRGDCRPEAVFEVEARRTFPVCYEGDNQQRVVPQRLTGWSVPAVDRDVLEVYSRIPYCHKLNRSMFLKTVRVLLGEELARIPDANTGARVGATAMAEWWMGNRLRLQRKLRGLRRSMITEGSWPDWQYYVAHSRRLDALWRRPNPEAMDFFRRVLGPANVLARAGEYRGDRTFRFVAMLTLKLWFDQRR